MKLKKIVSLAMAGVLAVSMLAGCEFKAGSSSSTEQEPAADDLTSAVVAALNEDLDGDVTFTAAASKLQNALQVLVNNVGSLKTAYTSGGSTKLAAIDPSFETALLPAVNNTNTNASSKKEQTTTVVSYVDKSDVNVTYLAKAITSTIKGLDVANTSLDLTELPMSDTAATYKNDDGKVVYYTFKYTGTVAVVPVVNSGASSATTGYLDGTTTGYAIAITVTRTPTEVLA